MVEIMRYPVRACVYLLLALFVSSCATKHDKLQSYVGKDIQKVVADFGYPRVAFDMEKGRRDFQWTIKSSTFRTYTISVSAITDTEQQFYPVSKARVITPTFAGKAIASECSYTMLTRWDEDKQSWIVTDHHKPTNGC